MFHKPSLLFTVTYFELPAVFPLPYVQTLTPAIWEREKAYLAKKRVCRCILFVITQKKVVEGMIYLASSSDLDSKAILLLRKYFILYKTLRTVILSQYVVSLFSMHL